MPANLIGQFLKGDESSDSPHPLIRTWGRLLSQKEGEAHCCVDRRRQGLSYLPTRLCLKVQLQSGEEKSEYSDWDADLNRWLINQKVKAINLENEAVRFQLVLREELQKTEIRLGDGYFSAVLIEVLIHTGLAADPRIANVLSKVAVGKPHYGDLYTPAEETIRAALSTCARSLKDLGYDEESMLNILVGAIVRYLDDRFSVTNRSILGLD